MKYATFILLTLCLLFIAQLPATARIFSEKNEGDFYQTEKEQTKDDSAKNLEGTVEVAFKIDGTGKVEILSINATSTQLADYVMKKLNKIQLERSDPQIGQIIKYRFVFKKQV